MQHWTSPDDAAYPCILKAAIGEHGQDIHIVRSAAEVLAVTRSGFGSKWLLQEMIPGCLGTHH